MISLIHSYEGGEAGATPSRYAAVIGSGDSQLTNSNADWVALFDKITPDHLLWVRDAAVQGQYQRLRP